MSNRKKIFNFNEHLQDNFWLYMISLLCVFTGIVLGIYAVKYMGDFENSNLSNYLSSFTENIGQENFQYRNMFTDILKNNLPYIISIWFLGLTMIGIPIILVIDLIKGFTLGFTISFMIKGFGTKGISVVLLGVLPQNLVYIPCIIISSVIAMEFSMTILKDRINKQWTSSIWMKITSYSFSYIIIFLIMCCGFALETFITPHLVKFILA